MPPRKQRRKNSVTKVSKKAKVEEQVVAKVDVDVDMREPDKEATSDLNSGSVSISLLIPLDFALKLTNTDREHEKTLACELGVVLATEVPQKGQLEGVLAVSGTSKQVYDFIIYISKQEISTGDSIQVLIDEELYTQIVVAGEWIPKTVGLPFNEQRLVLLGSEQLPEDTVKLLNVELLQNENSEIDRSKIVLEDVLAGGYGDAATFTTPQLVNQQLLKITARHKQNAKLGRTNTGAPVSIENTPSGNEAEEATAGLPANGVANISSRTGFFQARNQLAVLAKAHLSDGQPTTLRVVVPQEYVGGLIGKGGIRITEMRNLSGANLRVDMTNENRSDPQGQRIVAIHGQLEQVRSALSLLYKRLEVEIQNNLRK